MVESIILQFCSAWCFLWVSFSSVAARCQLLDTDLADFNQTLQNGSKWYSVEDVEALSPLRLKVFIWARAFPQGCRYCRWLPMVSRGPCVFSSGDSGDPPVHDSCRPTQLSGARRWHLHPLDPSCTSLLTIPSWTAWMYAGFSRNIRKTSWTSSFPKPRAATGKTRTKITFWCAERPQFASDS